MATFITIHEETAGQRIDNFLFTTLKGVPKSRIYRGLRKGEFRVNGGRISASYRLRAQDCLRIPPLRVAEPEPSKRPSKRLLAFLESRILYEDEQIMAINKPSGIPVHGGTNVTWGLIELLRQLRPQTKLLELIHRLDRETSGCLLIAKRRAALLEWHELLANRQVRKQYSLLIVGRWNAKQTVVDLPLRKNVLQSGERMVTVDKEGKQAKTSFQILKTFGETTLLSATLMTGRTHQLRVHAAACGHPIVGDDKYGNTSFNRRFYDKGLKRLFLHCTCMEKRHKTKEGFQGIRMPLDDDLKRLIERISESNG